MNAKLNFVFGVIQNANKFLQPLNNIVIHLHRMYVVLQKAVHITTVPARSLQDVQPMSNKQKKHAEPYLKTVHQMASNVYH